MTACGKVAKWTVLGLVALWLMAIAARGEGTEAVTAKEEEGQQPSAEPVEGRIWAISAETRTQVSNAILKGIKNAKLDASSQQRAYKAVKLQVLAVLGAQTGRVSTAEVSASGQAEILGSDSNGGRDLALDVSEPIAAPDTAAPSAPATAWDTISSMFGWMSKAAVVVGVAMPLTVLASTVGFVPTSGLTGVVVYAAAVWLVKAEIGLPWGGGDRIAAIEAVLSATASDSASLLEPASLMLFGGTLMCVLAMQAFLVPPHIALDIAGSTRPMLMMVVSVAGPSPSFWPAHVLLFVLSGAGVALLPSSWMLWLLVWLAVGHLAVDLFAHVLLLITVCTSCGGSPSRPHTGFSLDAALIVITSAVAATSQLLLVLLVATFSAMLAASQPSKAPGFAAALAIRLHPVKQAEPVISFITEQASGQSLSELLRAAPALAAALQPAALAGVIACVWALCGLAVSIATSLRSRPGARRLALSVVVGASAVLVGSLITRDPATVEVTAVILAVMALPAALQAVVGWSSTSVLDRVVGLAGGLLLALRSPTAWAAFEAAGGSLENPQAVLATPVLQEMASLSMVDGSDPLLASAGVLVAVAVVAGARSPRSRAETHSGLFDSVTAAAIVAVFGAVSLVLLVVGTVLALFPSILLPLIPELVSAVLWLPLAFLSPIEWVVGFLYGHVALGLLLLIGAALSLFVSLTLNPRASAVAMESILLPATIAALVLMPSHPELATGAKTVGGPLSTSLLSAAPGACEWLFTATVGFDRHHTIALLLTVLHRIVLRRVAGLVLRELTLPGQVLAAAIRSFLVLSSMLAVYHVPELHEHLTTLLGPVAAPLVQMSFVAVLGDLVASLVRSYNLYVELHTSLPILVGVLARGESLPPLPPVAPLDEAAYDAAFHDAATEEDRAEHPPTDAAPPDGRDEDDVNAVVRALMPGPTASGTDFGVAESMRQRRIARVLRSRGLPVPGTSEEASALLPSGATWWVLSFGLHAASATALSAVAGMNGSTWVALAAVALAPQALLMLGRVDAATTRLPPAVRVALLCIRVAAAALGIYVSAVCGSDKDKPSLILASAIAAAFCTGAGEQAIGAASFHELPRFAAPLVATISSACLVLVRLALRPGTLPGVPDVQVLPMAVVIAATALATALATTLQLLFARDSGSKTRLTTTGDMGGEPLGLAASGSGAIHSNLLAIGLALPMIVDPSFGWILGDASEAFSPSWVIQASVVAICVWLATSAPVVADTTSKPTMALLLVGLLQVTAVVFATVRGAALLPLLARLFSSAVAIAGGGGGGRAGGGAWEIVTSHKLPDMRIVMFGGPDVAAASSAGLSLDAAWALTLCRCGLAILLSVPLYKPTPRLVRVAIAALLLCDPIAASFSIVVPIFIAWQLCRPQQLETHITDFIGTWATVIVLPILTIPDLVPGIPSLNPAVGVPSLLLFSALMGASEQLSASAWFQPWATLAASLAMLAHLNAATFWWPAADGAAQAGVIASWVGGVTLALVPPLLSAARGATWQLLLVGVVGTSAMYVGAHRSHSPLLAAAGAISLFAGFVVAVTRASRGRVAVIVPVASIALGAVLSLLSQAAQEPDPVLAASKQMEKLLDIAVGMIPL